MVKTFTSAALYVMVSGFVALLIIVSQSVPMHVLVGK